MSLYQIQKTLLLMNYNVKFLCPFMLYCIADPLDFLSYHLNQVSSWRDFMKGGKKVKKGELRPPKLKTEDPNKSCVQRPVNKDLGTSGKNSLKNDAIPNPPYMPPRYKESALQQRLRLGRESDRIEPSIPFLKRAPTAIINTLLG
ncbi:hypothetical protein Tco_1397029, partial [Tanacetum coccineum]